MIIRRGMKQCGFPVRFFDYDPEKSFKIDGKGKTLKYRQQALDWYFETIQDLDGWIRHGNSVYLNGSVGTGKTGFVCALAKEAVRHWIKSGAVFKEAPLFILGGKLGDIVKTGRLSEEVKLARECLFTSKFLCIDDLLKAPNNDDSVRFIDNILRTRWNNRLSTLITSQVPKEDLKDFLTESISDLISDYEIIIVPGLSKRGR